MKGRKGGDENGEMETSMCMCQMHIYILRLQAINQILSTFSSNHGCCGNLSCPYWDRQLLMIHDQLCTTTLTIDVTVGLDLFKVIYGFYHKIHHH